MKKMESFEDDFTTSIELLGENPNELIEAMGQYDDIDENEHRTFVCFENNNSQFGFNNDGIFMLSMPTIDAFGHRLETADEYYTYKGLKLGMSKEEVINVWGEPISQGSHYWLIEKFRISNGNDVSIHLGFSQPDEDIEEYYLASFDARLIERKPDVKYEKPKSGCFIATACYSDYNSPEVLVLRDYRDNVLLKTKRGRIFVSIYYRLSPPFANLIGQSNLLKAFVRNSILSPIVLKIKQKQKQISI